MSGSRPARNSALQADLKSKSLVATYGVAKETAAEISDLPPSSKRRSKAAKKDSDETAYIDDDDGDAATETLPTQATAKASSAPKKRKAVEKPAPRKKAKKAAASTSTEDIQIAESSTAPKSKKGKGKAVAKEAAAAPAEDQPEEDLLEGDTVAEPEDTARADRSEETINKLWERLQATEFVLGVFFDKLQHNTTPELKEEINKLTQGVGWQTGERCSAFRKKAIEQQNNPKAANAKSGLKVSESLSDIDPGKMQLDSPKAAPQASTSALPSTPSRDPLKRLPNTAAQASPGRNIQK